MVPHPGLSLRKSGLYVMMLPDPVVNDTTVQRIADRIRGVCHQLDREDLLPSDRARLNGQHDAYVIDLYDAVRAAIQLYTRRTGDVKPVLDQQAITELISYTPIKVPTPRRPVGSRKLRPRT